MRTPTGWKWSSALSFDSPMHGQEDDVTDQNSHSVPEMVAQYRRDLEREGQTDTPENRNAWLWFACPAPMRAQVRAALETAGQEA